MAKRPVIHDELNARCLALDDGKTKLVFVVADSCVIGRGIFDEAKKMVNEATGLPMENMMMSATHSHSCGTLQAVGQSEPNPIYQRFVARRIADGVRRALNNLAPAKIGHGSASVPWQVFNRRWKMKPGSILPTPLGVTTDQVKTNPGISNPPCVEPAGPTDPEVGFISVQSVDGKPLALAGELLAALRRRRWPGAHLGGLLWRVCGEDRPVARRGAGVRRHHVERHQRRHQQHRLPWRSGQRSAVWPHPDRRQRCRAGRGGCGEVREALEDWVPLAVAQKEITLGLRIPTKDEVEKAREVMKTSKLAPRMETMEQVYARETVLLADFPAKKSPRRSKS
jgi:neutral ceramidase